MWLCVFVDVDVEIFWILTSILSFHRMSHQQNIINGNSTSANNLQTLQHYLVNNHIQQPDQLQMNTNSNVHVQIVKQEQAQQRFIINRQYIQQSQGPPQVKLVQIEAHAYWLIVEIESNNELNSYALVESKDVIGQPSLDSLNTGKLVIVSLNGKQSRATVVMASSKMNRIILTESFSLILNLFY